MKKLLTTIAAIATFTLTFSTHAGLNPVHCMMAENVGKANAALIEQMPQLYSKASARQMAKMQASLFGLGTKEEIVEFIDIAEASTLKQLEILKEIE